MEEGDQVVGISMTRVPLPGSAPREAPELVERVEERASKSSTPTATMAGSRTAVEDLEDEVADSRAPWGRPLDGFLVGSSLLLA